MKTNSQQIRTVAALCGVLTAGTLSLAGNAQAQKAILPLTPPSVSTVPPNGDVNPYGVAVVPHTLLGTTDG